MAKTRRNTGSTDQPALERNSHAQLRLSYGFLLRVKIDDPLGDYSEQTGAQFG